MGLGHRQRNLYLGLNQSVKGEQIEMTRTYLCFGLACLENDILGHIVGHVSGSSEGESLLMLPGGVNTFDLVCGVTHESNDHRGTILLPIRWVELTCIECDSVKLGLSSEKSVLDLGVVDTCTLQGVNVASVGMTPFLDRSENR